MKLEIFLRKTGVLAENLKNIFPDEIEVEVVSWRVKVIVKTEMTEDLFEKILNYMQKLEYLLLNVKCENNFVVLYFGLSRG